MVAAFLNAVKSSMSFAQYLQWSEMGERLSQIRTLTLSWQLWPLSAIIARADVYHLHEKGMTNQTCEEGVSLHHLRVFLKVAEYEHVTHASEELFISQSAVTKIVQQLEHEVGLELIERHGRRIVLTYAGNVLSTYARRLFALEREMEEALVALQEVEVREVSIGASTTTGVYLLPPIVARFRTRYPQVNLHIAILNSLLKKSLPHRPTKTRDYPARAIGWSSTWYPKLESWRTRRCSFP